MGPAAACGLSHESESRALSLRDAATPSPRPGGSPSSAWQAHWQADHRRRATSVFSVATTAGPPPPASARCLPTMRVLPCSIACITLLMMCQPVVTFLHTSVTYISSLHATKTIYQPWIYTSKPPSMLNRKFSKSIVCVASGPKANDLQSIKTASSMIFNEYSEISKGQIQVHEVEQGA